MLIESVTAPDRSTMVVAMRSSLRIVTLSLATTTVLLGLWPSAPASAAPASLVIDTLTPEVQKAESGGGSQVALSLTNLTDGPATLEVEATGCTPSLSKNQLPPNQITPVSVEIPKSCPGGGLGFKLTAGLAGGTSQSFEVSPKGTAASAPDWQQLWAFAIALLAALLFSVVFYWRGWEPKGKAKRKLSQPLGSLDATWKFNDNWATNATGAGALLAGLFSATTAKSFLGPNAEALTALATVGGAIALILAAAAPIVVVATKSYKVSDHKRGDAFTVGGVLLGAVLIIASAAGQLWIVADNASQLDLGEAGWLIWVGFGVAIILLLTYSFRCLSDLLERGTEEKATEPETEIEAAKLIVKAIEAAAKTDSGEKKQTFAELAKTIKDREVKAGERYRQRPRSALL